MSDSNKKIADIKEKFRLYDPLDWFYIQKCDFDGIADAYEALQAENAELREALGHYANRQTWACGNTGYLHECGCEGQKTGDCSKCYYNSYQGDGQGWETAQTVLDKHKSTT